MTFKVGDKVRFTKTNPNGGEKYGKEGDTATILVPDTGYSHEYHSNQAEVNLPGCTVEPNVPWSVLELIQDGPVRTVQRIIPGTYDGVEVGSEVTGHPQREVMVRIAPDHGPMVCMDHTALTNAAAVLTALAGALRDGE